MKYKIGDRVICCNNVTADGAIYYGTIVSIDGNTIRVKYDGDRWRGYWSLDKGYVRVLERENIYIIC